MISAGEKAAVFARHEFFRGLSPAGLARCTAHARLLAYAPGARIFAKGDASYGLMAVLEGVVRISVQSGGSTELTLNLIGPDGVFGEIALIDGQPRTADATAMTACRLLILERRDFLATLEQEPAAALSLLQIVSTRLRRTSEQLEQASFGPMSKRLAQALIALGATTAPNGPAPVRIRMAQRQIGNMIGLSRESTNRYLRQWHRDGLVSLEPGGLTIRDRQALAALAEDEAGRG